MREYRSSKNVSFKYAKGKSDIFGKMFHDCYEIYLLLNGTVEFTNNHRKQILQPLSVVVIPPGEYHQFDVKGNIDVYERSVIDIYPEFLSADILKKAFFGKEVLSFSESDRIIGHFDYLRQCLFNVDEFDFSHILSAVAADIVFIIKNTAVVHQLYCENINSLSLGIMNYINAHFTEQVDLYMLSQKFFCSVSSLCHIFKKDFGISIKKYILQKRINAAKMEIQRGAKPEEVSIKYGFSNYSAFYRLYKKYFGISPSKTTDKKNAHLF